MDHQRFERRDAIATAAIALLHAVFAWLAHPGGVFSKYPDAAHALARHDTSLAAADYSPLYLWTHVLFPPEFVRGLQAVAGGLTVFACAAAAMWLAGRLAGYVVCVLTAVSGTLWVYEATLEPEVFIACAHAVALAGLIYAQRGERTRAALGVVGLAMGVSVALRPSAALFVGLGALLVALRAKGRDRFIHPLWVVLPALLFAGTVTTSLRAAYPSTAAVMSPGAVFQMGNNPAATGVGAQAPYALKMYERQLARYAAHEVYRRFAEASLKDAGTSGDVEGYWLQQSLNFLADNPTATLSLAARKALFFFLGRDVHDVVEAREVEASLRSRTLLFLEWLGPLACASALFLLLRHRARAWALLSLWVAVAASALVFYAISRYRLAALPAMTLACGLAVTELWDRRSRTAWLVAGGCAALVGALSFASPVVRASERATERALSLSEHVTAIRQALPRGDFAVATRAFVSAQAVQPFISRTLDLRGIAFESPELASDSGRVSLEKFGDANDGDALVMAWLAVRAGYCERAMAPLQRVPDSRARLTVFDAVIDGPSLAAECAMRRNDFTQARTWLQTSLERTPQTLDALAGLTALLRHTEGPQSPDSASARKHLFRYHDAISAHLALSGWYFRSGEGDAALEEAEAGLRLLPDFGLLHAARANALATLSRAAESCDAMATALERFPGYPFPVAGYQTVAEACAQAAPRQARARWLLAEVRLRTGNFEGARELLNLADVEGPEVERLKAMRRSVDSAVLPGPR